MQLVPQFQFVPVLPSAQFGFAVRQIQQLQQFGFAGVPILVQPVQVPVLNHTQNQQKSADTNKNQPSSQSNNVTVAPATEQLLRALHNAALELEKLPTNVDCGGVRQRLRNFLMTLPSDSLDSFVKECETCLDKLVKEILLRCKQVHPVEIWTLLRNKGCQFLGQYQSTILQSLINVLRQNTIMPRKTLIELVVETCEKNNARVSKTAVGRVVQLLYRSGCFHIHKDGESTESEIVSFMQQPKNTRMQLRDEYFNYEALRRTHDSLIVQWAHEEGLLVSAERWSQMLYQDRAHKAYLQAIIDQKSIPLTKLNDILYQNSRSVPSLSTCVNALQQFVSMPAIASKEGRAQDSGSPVAVTIQDVHCSLQCILSLLNAFTALLKAPSPSVAPPRLIASEAPATPRGRYLFGARHTPNGSVTSSQDECDQQSPTASNARASSSSMNSPTSNMTQYGAAGDVEELDSDFDERMSASESPAYRAQLVAGPSPAATHPRVPQSQPIVPLAAVEKWMTGSSFSEPKSGSGAGNVGDSDWDAWKWQGPQDLINGNKKQSDGLIESLPLPLGADSEDVLIVPMINQLIGDDAPRSTMSKRPVVGYSRTASSTVADNLLLPMPSVGIDDDFSSRATGSNYPSLFRVASFQDPNSLHF